MIHRVLKTIVFFQDIQNNKILFLSILLLVTLFSFSNFLIHLVHKYIAYARRVFASQNCR